MNEVKKDGKVIKNVIAARIIAALKLDDNGKVEKFFAGEVKALKSEIKNIEANKQNSEIQLGIKLSNIDDQIEDATADVENAYDAVAIENINSNEAMKSFSTKYWTGIDRAEEKLESLVKEKAFVQEAYEKELKARNEKIAIRETRIAKISQTIEA